MVQPFRQSARLHLFILVDALGWRVLQAHEFLRDLLPYRRPLRTILGYSSGAIPTLLTGTPPAVHGHWNLLYFDPAASPFRWLKPFRRLPASLLDNRLARRLLTALGRCLRLGPGFECCVAPGLLPYFSWCEKHDLYAPGGLHPTASVFDRWQEAGLDFRIFSYRQGNDVELIHRAQATVVAGEGAALFLYLSELDHWLHEHRPDEELVAARLAWYEAQLRPLLQRALARDPGAHIALFSDHGMAPVEHHFDLARSVAALGLRLAEDYLAVYDATMARFWVFTQRARDRLTDLLHRLPCGRLLTRAELRDEGVYFADHRFGELIYLLHPRWIVASGDFTRPGWRPRGMHGYHPDDPDSDAVYASNREPDAPMRAIADVCGTLRLPLHAAPVSVGSTSL